MFAVQSSLKYMVQRQWCCLTGLQSVQCLCEHEFGSLTTSQAGLVRCQEPRKNPTYGSNQAKDCTFCLAKMHFLLGKNGLEGAPAEVMDHQQGLQAVPQTELRLLRTIVHPTQQYRQMSPPASSSQPLFHNEVCQHLTVYSSHHPSLVCKGRPCERCAEG